MLRNVSGVTGVITQHDDPSCAPDGQREEYEAIHRAGFVLQLDCPIWP
jgi:hypothetical protein